MSFPKNNPHDAAYFPLLDSYRRSLRIFVPHQNNANFKQFHFALKINPSTYKINRQLFILVLYGMLNSIQFCSAKEKNLLKHTYIHIYIHVHSLDISVLLML